MANESEEVVTPENDEEQDVDTEESEDSTEEAQTEETKVEKPKETPEAKRARLKRQLDQLDKKHGFKDEVVKPESKSKKSSETDYGLLAYFEAKEIPEADQDYVLATAKESHIEPKDLLAKKWFQAELKERQETRKVRDATPTSTKRSAPVSKTSEEYQVNRYLNGTPIEDIPKEFRGKAIDARLKKEKTSTAFSTTV